MCNSQIPGVPTIALAADRRWPHARQSDVANRDAETPARVALSEVAWRTGTGLEEARKTLFAVMTHAEALPDTHGLLHLLREALGVVPPPPVPTRCRPTGHAPTGWTPGRSTLSVRA